MLLGIPRELRMHILSYVVLNHTTIEVSEDHVMINSPERFYRQDTIPVPTHIFLACREMYICGFEIFWGRNTFSFERLRSLKRFVRTLRPQIVQSIQILELVVTSPLIRELFHRIASTTPPGQRIYAQVPIYSFDILISLTGLRHLRLNFDYYYLASFAHVPHLGGIADRKLRDNILKALQTLSSTIF